MRIRSPVAAVALAALLITASEWRDPSPVLGASITDDFSRYPEGSDAGSAWDTGSMGWEVRHGELESDGAGHSFGLPLAAPHGRRLVIEATVVLRHAVGKEWKVAGLAVVCDESNFWHFAVVERPDSQGSGHFVELTEMVRGKWLANYEGATKLTATTDRGGDFNWQYDHPYRFRLEVTQEGIEGIVAELGGTERVRKGFAFGDSLAVASGRPALVTNSLAAGFDNLEANILEEAAPPAKPVRPPYGVANDGPARGKATGFFHVERVEDRWWVVDPNGRLFYVVGTDHVNYNAHWCEKLGYAPYHRNLEAKFGSEDKWAASASDRLKQWGFNTLGAGHSPSVRYRGLAHTDFLSLGSGFVAMSDIAPRVYWTGFPDVFHPKFQGWCEREARRRCAPQRDDPWLLGYFLDNELEWYGKNASETGLVDEAFKKPADHPAKRALIDFLRQRYPTITAFNKAWGADAESYDTLAQATEPTITRTDAGQKDRRDFVRLIAERYLSITTAAIRKADPNHMVLGCRFAGSAPPIWDLAGKYLDIISVNYYGQVDLERGLSPDMPKAMAKYYAEGKRPLMITEWSFPALDAGLPSQHGAGQRVPTQKEKASCYAIYQKTLFGLPFMVGSDYFMWVDEPALGISSTFPEDSNYGLVDVNDDAWPELTQTASRINRLALVLHAGRTAELSGEIIEKPPPVLRVRNSGKSAASCVVRVWIQGIESATKVTLPAGAGRDLPVRLSGPAFVAAEIDPDDSVPETDKSDNRVERVILTPSRKGPVVVVANPSMQELRNVPVSVALGRLGEKWQASDSAGRPVVSQVDLLPGGAELAFVIPQLPARSVLTFPLKPGAASLSQKESSGDRSFSLSGPMRVEHGAGSGNLFDRVQLGDMVLGRFTVLVHQVNGQPLWVQPDHIEQIETYTGPVRTVLLVTAGLKAPDRSPAKTAVDGQGAYAKQERRAGRFRITVRVSHYAAEQWFGARLLKVENTDDRPWRCESYFHYPVSFIAGKAEDDRASGLPGAPLWYDATAGASYGAIVDLQKMRAHFWKDAPDSAGEHPDIWRELKQDLRPGQAIEATDDDLEVLIFGSRSSADRPGGDMLDRVRALAKVRVTFVGGER